MCHIPAHSCLHLLTLSVKRTAKSSSALMMAPPNSPTWFSWWSSTSSTEEYCLVNSNIHAPLWPYDICRSPDHPPTPAISPFLLTWLCLKQTKQQGPLCWIFCLYRYEKLVNWLIVLFVVILYCHESTGDCWHVGFLLVLHGCVRSQIHNLLMRFHSREKERERKYGNAAVLIDAVTKSFTIMLPSVINKLGHNSADCVSL